MENSERDGNTRPPDHPLEKPICRSGSNSQNWTWTGSKQEKEYVKAVYCHCVYLTEKHWADEAQVGMKIAGRNINNLTYAEDTTLMTES